MTLDEIEKTIEVNKRDIRLVQLNIDEGYMPERSAEIQAEAREHLKVLAELKRNHLNNQNKGKDDGECNGIF